MTLQAQYNLATRETEWEMIPAALHNGLGILAWSPLASGFLTGKYSRGEQRSPGTRAGQDHALYQYTSSNYETSGRTWNAVDAINQVAKAGKARYLGASSMDAWQFAKLQQTAALGGWTRFAAMQNQYNLLRRQEERELLPMCADMGVGVVPYSRKARDA